MSVIRKYLSLLFLLALCPLCPAQSFHFLYFSDTNDSNIGKSCEETNRYFLNNFIPQVRKHTNLKVRVHQFSGSSFTRNNLNTVLKELESGRDDVIFFYYTGHGYNNDTNDYPNLTLGLRSDPMPSRLKSLLSVYNTLREKPHRLLVVIGEACNKVYSSALKKESYAVSFDPFQGDASKYRTLFQEQRGDYLMSSSKKNELTFGVNDEMGVYSRAFSEVIDGDLPITTWPELFDAVADVTAREAKRRIDEEQHPQWISGDYRDGASHVQGASERIYLRVDDEESRAYTTFSSATGTESFSVSTNASSFQIQNLPDWCHLDSKSSDSFTIRYDENAESSTREASFTVSAGHASVRVSVTQTGAASEWAISGTSREYADTADGLTYLTTAIKERKECRLGAITENGQGVIVYGSNGCSWTGVSSNLSDKMKSFNKDGKRFSSLTLTNSGHYCVVYGRNGWYGHVPENMKKHLNQFTADKEEIMSVSISETGQYAIITDKHYVSSDRKLQNFIKKANELYGQLKNVCVTDLGICVVCQKGIYYQNIPSNLEQKLKSIDYHPDHVVFTDAGTFLITTEKGRYNYHM